MPPFEGTCSHLVHVPSISTLYENARMYQVICYRNKFSVVDYSDEAGTASLKLFTSRLAPEVWPLSAIDSALRVDKVNASMKSIRVFHCLPRTGLNATKNIN